MLEQSQKNNDELYSLFESIGNSFQIRKRWGSELEPFEKEKLIQSLNRKLLHLSPNQRRCINKNLILKTIPSQLFNQISTLNLEEILLLCTSALIEYDPAYDRLSAIILLHNIYKEFGLKKNQHLSDPDYLPVQDTFKTIFMHNINLGINQKILDPRLLEFDLQLLSSHLNFENDHLLNYMGLQTLHKRYFLHSHTDKLIELPQTFWMRIAMGLAILEKNKNEKAIQYYNLISQLKYIPSTPTLFHAGLAIPQLASCYLNTVPDDLKGIFKVLGDNAQLSKWSGGIGTDWTNIRATGSYVKSTRIQSQGLIPFLKIANDVTLSINRSGRRRGATCVYLELWHADIEGFLDLRRNTGDDRRRTHDLNTALWVPDLFMKRLENNENWSLFSSDEVPDLHSLYGQAFEQRYDYYEKQAQQGYIKIYKTIPAQQLWRLILTRIFETGHPWITFKDACNIRSPQDHAGVVHSSNLCTEITLNTSLEETAVCNLGSINLSEHLNSDCTSWDVDKLKHTVYTAVEMLDNVIDLCFYPTVEAKKANLTHRAIALGTMGWQDIFFKMHIPMSGTKAIELTDRLMEQISYYAIEASCQLAQQRGNYKSFEGSKWSHGIFPVDTLNILQQERQLEIHMDRQTHLDWDSLKQKVKKGIRNSNIMGMAPTATISTIAGCYPSIEAMYSNIYVKSNMSGEFTVINHYLIEDLKHLGLWNQDMLNQIKYYDGQLTHIEGIPTELKTLYTGVFDIDPLHLLKMCAVRGKWIDQSQSYNIFMKGNSGKALDNIYRSAWHFGLKTTYYLRVLAKSQIEKSTLKAEYGFTQKR